MTMVYNHTFRNLVFQFDNVEEHPHFHRKAFRIKGKTIFVTLDEKDQTANLNLTEIEQSVFCQIDKEMIYPVAGAWGRNGWTTVNLKKVTKEVLAEALKLAYGNAAKKKTKYKR